MTLALIGALIGAAFGALRARKADGNRLDIIQYASVYGIAFALIGMIIAITLVRSV